MSLPPIQIRGAREHNLQGVDVDIPRNQLVVLTGVSGSGKSSLAFDTLFAEGQRRYVESLSAYARQFLGQMVKPRYDRIQGLTPTIAVSQGAGSRNPRSTVGTLTEVHDHLRVLFARAGVQHCHRCGRVVERTSAAEIVHALRSLPAGSRVTLLAPVVRARQGHLGDLLQDVRQAGFARVRLDGEVVLLDDLPPPARDRTHDLDVVVDRLVVSPEGSERLADSVETTLKAGNGVVIAMVQGSGDLVFTDRLRCVPCDLVFPDLTPTRFSFNSPDGACPACNGLGTRNEIDPALVVPDPALSIHQGAVVPIQGPTTKKEGWTYAMLSSMSEAMGFSLDTPWRDLPERARRGVLFGDADTFQVTWSGSRNASGTFDTSWEGVITSMVRRMKETKSEQMRAMYMEYMADGTCGDCGGSRLRPESVAVRVGSLGIVDVGAMAISRARQALGDLRLEGARATIGAALLKEVDRRLRFLEDVGLGYLTLDRPADTLSGGESQRIRLASQLGGELTGVTYVLDEPSIGLHPRDTTRLLGTLTRLRDLGNTVVVVEHDRETMEAADWLLDFGPGAGRMGGHLIYAGPPSGITDCGGSVTGDWLAGRRSLPRRLERRPPRERWLRVVGARENNLRDITVEIPLGCMVAITGVSGAGKSSLVHRILSPTLHNHLHHARRPVGACDRVEGLEHLTKVIDIDQSPIGRTPRSNPATYTKALDGIREVFAKTRDAKARGYSAARFSFNAKGGRCEACQGDGFRRVEMHFLADMYVPCEVCGGRRFNEATLEVKYKGLDIAQVLDLTIDEARSLFAPIPDLRRILDTVGEVGLGYLQLGQPSDTLSGGEAQRVKLSRELARISTGDTLYLLDEPTTGLHFEDIKHLLAVLDRLADAGNTVLIVEHNPEVIRACDHVVDLGPEGGDAGGRVVATGTPEEVARTDTHTGKALRAIGT